MARIGILIVDDENQILRAFMKILSSYADFEILGIASSGYEAVLETVLLQPDIILMDCDMEAPAAGIHASKALLQRFPHMKIILLIEEVESELIQAAAKAGIVDYIPKNASPSEIIKIIKEVDSLDNPKQQSITEKYYQRTVHHEGVRDSLMYTLTVVSQLKPAELEIIRLLIEGKSLEQISQIRKIDTQSLNRSIKYILQKFNKKSIDELIKVFVTLNITELLDFTV